MLGFFRRATPGEKRLAGFAEVRADTLERLLQAECTRALGEYAKADVPKEGAIRLHPQCEKDFDRAEYKIGGDWYQTGAAASSGDMALEFQKFRNRLSAECGSEELTYVVSALASQLSMAHLSTVCYSGCHEFAVRSGFTFARYDVERAGSSVAVTIERVSEHFEDFSLPGEEPYPCDKESFIKHHARALLHVDKKGDIETKLDTVWEAIRLIWPNKRLVVSGDGLELDFRSPAPPSALRSSLAGVFNMVTSPVRCFVFVVIAMLCAVGARSHRLAAAVASSFVAAIGVTLWKIPSKRRKEL